MHSPLLTKSQVLATAWTLTSIALVFFATRIFIRLRLFKKLMADDALLAFALVMVVVVAIITSIQLDSVIQLQDSISRAMPPPSSGPSLHGPPPPNGPSLHGPPPPNGPAPPNGAPSPNMAPPPSVVKEQQFGKKLSEAATYCFFTGLWAVKGSFLASYYPITHDLPKYRIAWYCITAFTIVTWVIALVLYGLFDRGTLADSSYKKALDYVFGSDLATDVFITALPLTLSFKSNFTVKRKLALSGVFSLMLIITIFSMLRYILTSPGVFDPPGSPTWAITWSMIGASVSVIVACLSSFRSLAVAKSRTQYAYDNRASNGRPYYFDENNKGSGQSGYKKKSGNLSLSGLSSNPRESHQRLNSTDIELSDYMGSPGLDPSMGGHPRHQKSGGMPHVSVSDTSPPDSNV